MKFPSIQYAQAVQHELAKSKIEMRVAVNFFKQMVDDAIEADPERTRGEFDFLAWLRGEYNDTPERAQ